VPVDVAHKEAQLQTLRSRRRRQARSRMIRRVSVVGVVAVALVALVVGEVYAGSSDTLPSGQTIAGVDVGGMSAAKATHVLEQRAAALAGTPVPVRVAGHTFPVRQADAGVTIDWARAVDSARAKSDGFGPLRGFRRLYQRIFGLTITPTAQVDAAEMNHELDAIVGSVGREPRDASIALHGLTPVIVAGRPGISIDRAQARKQLVDRFTRLERAPVVLPLAPRHPQVTGAQLARPLAEVRTAVSAPIVIKTGPASFEVGRWQLASMLRLPSAGSRTISLGGKHADAFILRLQKALDRNPTDATFAVSGPAVHIVPDLPGRTVDVPGTVKNIVNAALSPRNRAAVVVVDTRKAKRTVADAKAMGVKELVSSYTTEFGGVPNRIHNVQLVARLIDGALIAPGATFSFNGTTGERNASKGFLEAPVIVNGELTTGLGGGVCQVSTTVFNAAYDAGLNITARTNHALYISHYPQGRDATVNYPDLDLKFVNDTKSWLLLRTFVSTYSLTVNLYGTSPHRRVESTTAPLVVDGQPPTQWVKDPTLAKGTKVIVQAGSSPA